MKRLILMLQFLTKLPLPFEINATEEDFSKGVIYFPVVGLIIGLLMAGIFYGVSLISNSLIAAVLVVAFEVFITGGLHLDGLADTFDGLYSYRDKDRMLEIMKDSRVGTNGVLVLVISLTLKMALLYSISDPVKVIILMPVVSRCMVVLTAAISKYAREKGMGGFFIEKTSKGQLVVALLITAVLHIIKPELLFVTLVVLVLTLIYRYHVYSKIDGVTGDVLGAIVELSEVFYLMIYVLVLGV
ncbi:adenosylcobinamide-GDP ribazoletransferase [Acidaminobacter sp. JC074]|uniref:adenosylcobinamide-GDP ribazoletransferase n=1 Tax=Acidaminobacter sp. JC074 TaxID=2530199 RepID=UPI001F0E737B|nr:adenosylcobinamide-GDP ribazoletransferase [Acidaminobacter sp. JC074]MCH4889164.1 adenosylcobinamide-GDP ribazoletransferase [Acidaminobacter sp. JC074]